jgi:hypothetical protein
MVVPSWVKYSKSVPKNFGEASAGTLKADEWRTLASLYLPVALVCAWGEGSKHTTSAEAERRREVLDNTIDLVQAVILICRRSITLDTIDEYQKLMARYLRNLFEIHPDTKALVNMHMALHLKAFLTYFGPVHGWWTFVFERLIGHLQRLPSNNQPGMCSYIQLFADFSPAAPLRLGETAASMSRLFCRTNTLVRILKQMEGTNTPVALLMRIFNYSFGQENGILIAKKKTANRGRESLPSRLLAALESKGLPLSGVLSANHRISGKVFSRQTTHKGNSGIFYSIPFGSTTSRSVPGVIEYIYTSGEQTFYAVNRFKSYTGCIVNPFQSYPALHTSVFSTSLEDNLEIIHERDILGHLARFDMDSHRALIINLEKIFG